MKLIESIQYAPADQIVRWIPTGDSVVVQPFNEWSDLPITISARLKEQVSLPELLIIRVKFCNGTNVIVGSPDIPVDVSDNETLFLNTISISHNSITSPLNEKTTV